MKMVVDYNGNEIPAESSLVITYPSEYEGEYIHEESCGRSPAVEFADGTTREVILPYDEYNDNVTTMYNGTEIWFPDFDGTGDIVYCEYGCAQGDWIWYDNAVYCEDDDAYYHEHDVGDMVFWDERSGCYRNSDRPQGNCHGYHDGFRANLTTSMTNYTIGFEVEKEDEDVLNDYDLYDVDETQWCREEDSSLCDYAGFELVSPVFDLYTDRLDDSLTDPIVRAHIQASSSSNCGGHINLGRRNFSGAEFFDRIQAFVPLFLTIWRHRLGNHYSPLKRKAENYKGAGKYSAIHVKHNYIEIRLPGAVRNVTQLLWRRDLMRIVCANQDIRPLNLITAMLSPKTDIGAHLRKVYNEEQVLRVVSLYAQFADDFYSSYHMTGDGAGVYFKSVVRRLKNRKVTNQQIVSFANPAIERLRNAFGRSYEIEAQGTLAFYDKLLNTPTTLG